MADQAYQIAFAGEAASQDFYGSVVSLTVEENTSAASTLDMRLATRRKDDGSWELLDDPRFELFTKISVKAGFSGGQGLAGALGGLTGSSGNDGLEPVFDGFVTSVHLSLQSDPGATFIDVHAMDSTVLMSLEEKVARWPNLSDSDIARQILLGYGVQVQADSTSTTHQENDTTIVQRGTDLDFVRELARRNGLEFYFETDKTSGQVTAYFRAPQLDGAPQPDLAIQFGDGSNLRTFSARLDGLRPLNVKKIQQDVQANSTNSAQVSDTQLTKLGSQDANDLIGGPLGSLVTAQDAAAEARVLGPPTSDATEMQTLAQAVRDDAGWLIAAEGEINSQAYQAVLRSHRLVLVKGAGSAYSGKYYVTRVVHEIRADGTYTQRFEARRNARGLDGSEQFGGGGLGLPIPGV